MLRAARKALGLDHAALAKAAGISAETVRSYEGGRRKPTRPQLEKIVHALRIPADDANVLREALGYAPLRSLFTAEFERGYFFTREDIGAHLAEQPWPEFVLGDVMEIAAVNAACEAVWGIDFAAEQRTRTRAQMNVLAVANDRHFTDRIENWDEIVAVMVGVVKGASMTVENGNPYLGEVLNEFAKGDPVFLQRLLAIYESTPPAVPKVRWTYPVVWRIEPHGTMRFHGMVTTASEPDALSVNSWIPVDAESWRVLDTVKAAWAARS